MSLEEFIAVIQRRRQASIVKLLRRNYEDSFIEMIVDLKGSVK